MSPIVTYVLIFRIFYRGRVIILNRLYLIDITDLFHLIVNICNQGFVTYKSSVILQHKGDVLSVGQPIF